MKVSVIIPVYNVLPYLQRCLDSVVNQTLKNIEIIIVDDGSTDGSSALVDEYAIKDLRIKVVHKSNGGLMAAWMSGLEIATGDYVGFVDSDDFVDICMYEKLSCKAEETDSDIVLCNHYYDARESGGALSIHKNPISPGLYDKDNISTIHQLVLPQIGRDYISPSRCNKLFRIELLKKNLKFCDTRISSAEDVNIAVPCFLSARRVYYLDEPLYYYVTRSTSISHVFKEGILDTYIILIENLSKAISTYLGENESFVMQLWNFYGLLWSEYVSKSNLSRKELKVHISRLYAIGGFESSIPYIERSSGKFGLIYKHSMKKKNPLEYVVLSRAIHSLHFIKVKLTKLTKK